MPVKGAALDYAAGPGPDLNQYSCTAPQNRDRIGSNTPTELVHRGGAAPCCSWGGKPRGPPGAPTARRLLVRASTLMRRPTGSSRGHSPLTPILPARHRRAHPGPAARRPAADPRPSPAAEPQPAAGPGLAARAAGGGAVPVGAGAAMAGGRRQLWWYKHTGGVTQFWWEWVWSPRQSRCFTFIFHKHTIFGGT